jgi:hypothetical protein
MKTLSCAVILLLCYVFPAHAQQVYSGCSEPPSTFGNVWYIDPVNGQTAAAGGNGSQAHPWNSLQAVFGTVTGYPVPLLSGVAYRYVPSKGASAVFGKGPGAGPIKPGDEILLMSGNYGDITTSQYNTELANSSFLTIAAAPGQTPVLTSLLVISSTKMAFSGLKVQSLAAAVKSGASLVQVKDQGASYPTSNIVFENMTISSQDDVSGWSQAQWIANARNGFSAASTAGAPDTKCVSMTGSHISNVRFAAMLFANQMVFSGNEIDHFGDDGLDYAASYLSITKNSIHDNNDLGDGNHEDAMQGMAGTLAAGATVNNYISILIDSNTIIRQTDPNLAFPTYLQGIDAFDAEWTFITVTNNVVITSACNGIVYSSIHNSTIANNTVVNDQLVAMAGNCNPVVAVGNSTHEGNSSTYTLVRNNLVSALAVDNLLTGVGANNNVGLSGSGNAVFSWDVNGVAQFYSKPGIYANKNIIDTGGTAEEFQDFDPSTLTYNVMLNSGAQAIGAGATGNPTVDILGDAQTDPPSAGAYSSTAPE